jgi:hypothetical protein
MRFLSQAILLLSFFSAGIAQNVDTLNVNDAVENTYYLSDIDNPKKRIKIDPLGTLTFVKYEKSRSNNAGEELEREELEKYTASIASLENDSIALFVSEENRMIYENYIVASRNTGQYFETPKLFSLNLTDVDGVYYSSRRRDVVRNIMYSLLGVSVITTFVLAPVLSLEYKKTAAFDATGFDRPMYFAIAGAGLVGTAISLPLIYVLRPKYYSFKGDNFSSSKRRWSLVL